MAEFETWYIYEGNCDDDEYYRGKIGIMDLPWRGMVVQSNANNYSWEVKSYDKQFHYLYCKRVK